MFLLILASVAHEKRIVWSACDRRVIYLADTHEDTLKIHVRRYTLLLGARPKLRITLLTTTVLNISHFWILVHSGVPYSYIQSCTVSLESCYRTVQYCVLTLSGQLYHM
jgi:hypothetical protein